jgi:hypothetical protein
MSLGSFNSQFRGKSMQQRQNLRQHSGARAEAIDNRLLLAKYRLLQLLALMIGGAAALGLHFIFAR